MRLRSAATAVSYTHLILPQDPWNTVLCHYHKTADRPVHIPHNFLESLRHTDQTAVSYTHLDVYKRQMQAMCRRALSAE